MGDVGGGQAAVRSLDRNHIPPQIFPLAPQPTPRLEPHHPTTYQKLFLTAAMSRVYLVSKSAPPLLSPTASCWPNPLSRSQSLRPRPRRNIRRLGILHLREPGPTSTRPHPPRASPAQVAANSHHKGRRPARGRRVEGTRGRGQETRGSPEVGRLQRGT